MRQEPKGYHAPSSSSFGVTVQRLRRSAGEFKLLVPLRVRVKFELRICGSSRLRRARGRAIPVPVLSIRVHRADAVSVRERARVLSGVRGDVVRFERRARRGESGRAVSDVPVHGARERAERGAGRRAGGGAARDARGVRLRRVGGSVRSGEALRDVRDHASDDGAEEWGANAVDVETTRRAGRRARERWGGVVRRRRRDRRRRTSSSNEISSINSNPFSAQTFFASLRILFFLS